MKRVRTITFIMIIFLLLSGVITDVITTQLTIENEIIKRITTAILNGIISTLMFKTYKWWV